MTARSYFRGHPIVWDAFDECWRYEDDYTLLPGWGGEARPCAACGATWEDGQPDPCLGVLPGVDNACCGHGIPEEAYIRFHHHVLIRGFRLVECCIKEQANGLPKPPR